MLILAWACSWSELPKKNRTGSIKPNQRLKNDNLHRNIFTYNLYIEKGLKEFQTFSPFAKKLAILLTYYCLLFQDSKNLPPMNAPTYQNNAKNSAPSIPPSDPNKNPSAKIIEFDKFLRSIFANRFLIFSMINCLGINRLLNMLVKFAV